MKEIFDLNKQEIKEKILSEVEAIKGEGTHLVTLYVSKNLGLARTKIKSEISQLGRIQSKKTQKLVGGALNNILEALKQPVQLPIVVFSNLEKAYLCTIPESLAKDDYICDKMFDTSVLKTYSETRWGLVVLDTKESSIGLWQNGRVTCLSHKEYLIPPKIAAGGQSAQRFDETREIAVAHSLKDIVDRTKEHLGDKSVSKVLIGGVKPIVDNYYLSKDHDPRIKELLIPPLSIAYSSKAGLEMLVKKAAKEYQKMFEEYLEDEKKYILLTKDLARGKAGSLERYRGITFDTKPTFYLIAGLGYDDRYCETCAQYGNIKFCQHPTAPIQDLDWTIIFKPGMNADHIKKKYRGVVSF